MNIMLLHLINNENDIVDDRNIDFFFKTFDDALGNFVCSKESLYIEENIV